MKFVAFVIALWQFSCLLLGLDAKLACGCSPRRFRRQATKTVEVSFGNHNVTMVKLGDMLLDKTALATYAGFRAVDTNTKRWPKGHVKYYLNGLTPANKDKVRTALRRLTEATQGCVVFTEVSDLRSKEHKIEVTPTGGCWSILGMTSGYHGPQKLTLGPRCYDEGLIQHEFIHALGFNHEQDRPDRAQTIRFNWNNIHTQSCDLYKMCKGCKTYGPYDTKSVMHYAGNIAACDWNKPAMIRLDGGKIEYNKVLTEGDKAKIRALYECKGTGQSTVTS